MKYPDLIKINPIFQSSINLEFDMNDEGKIQQYIPTTDACKILEIYFEAILDPAQSSYRASALVGPYGKGKSFLIVVLMYLLSAESKSDTYQELLVKIKAVDDGLYAKIRAFNKKRMRLLPVLINSDYDDLVQAFIVAISEALIREGIEGLTPESAYDHANDILGQWENNKDAKINLLETCTGKHKVDIPTLRNGLSNHDKKAYRKFRELYKCMTYGLDFNPLVKKDVAKTISDVVHSLAEKKWTGVFIAFDEFSKFIGSDTPTLSTGLKSLQDVFELATRSGLNEQVHLCCITHQTLDKYSSGLGEVSQNAFRAIEGRVKEIHFTSSLGENFQIIASAIEKTDAFRNEVEEHLGERYPVYHEIENEPWFDTIDSKVLFAGCFPMNPFSTLSLVALSERVAQNERTLFTFISDNDPNSLNTFIQTNSEESGKLLNTDVLYNYFSPLLEKDDDKGIARVHHMVKLALRNKLSQEAIAFIKSLAVSLIADNQIMFPPVLKALSYAVGLPLDKATAAVEELEKKGIIRQNVFTSHIDFAPVNSAEIQKRVDDLRGKIKRSSTLGDIFSSIEPYIYYIPREYNTTKRMTRFYRGVFMMEKDLLGLPKLSSLYMKDECKDVDGIVVLVVRDKDDIKASNDLGIAIKERSEADDRVVVLVPSSGVSATVEDLAYETKALMKLSEDHSLSPTLAEEIRLSLEANRQDLIRYLDRTYAQDSVVYCDGQIAADRLNTLLSKQLERVFSKTPVINNSLVNKNNVSTQYSAARNIVVNRIINHESMDDLSPTSAHMTIFNAVDKNEDANLKAAIEDLREQAAKDEGKLRSFKELADIFMAPPYGIRRGVMPLLFAKAVEALPDSNLVFYRQKRELDYSGDTVAKAFDAPASYSFKLVPGTGEKYAYAENLVKIFGGTPDKSFRSNVSMALALMNKFCYALPPVVRDSKPNRNIAQLSQPAIKFKQELMGTDLNAFETVFETIPNALGCGNDDYKAIVKAVDAVRSELSGALDAYKTRLIEEFNSIFDADADSNIVSTVMLHRRNKLSARSLLTLDETSKRLENLFYGGRLGFDNRQTIDEISLIATGAFIQDWTAPARHDAWLASLTDYKNSCDDAEANVDPNPEAQAEGIDAYANLDKSVFSDALKNSIRSVRDEFSGSVSNEEFVGALAAIIKELTT